MDQNESIYFAFMGSLFTWGMTALGAAVVFMIPKGLSRDAEQKFLVSR